MFLPTVVLALSLVASARVCISAIPAPQLTGLALFGWCRCLGHRSTSFLESIASAARRPSSRWMERFQTHAPTQCSPEELHQHLPGHTGHLQMLARLVTDVVGRPLVAGNRIEPLVDGDNAFPAMLEAIAQAKKTISFQTYIFDRDEIGLAFAKAFGDARRRGVEVRVQATPAGTRYSWPSILRTLRREGVHYARFLPAFALAFNGHEPPDTPEAPHH